jgi:hypothetical protein
VRSSCPFVFNVAIVKIIIYILSKWLSHKFRDGPISLPIPFCLMFDYCFVLIQIVMIDIYFLDIFKINIIAI